MPHAHRALAKVLALKDFEALARKRLPAALYGYVSGACEDGHSLRENEQSFADYALTTRVLVDISAREQSVEIFGHRYSAPFGIAPMGVASMTAYRGDIVLAESAARANVPAIMSGWSLIPMEEVARAAPGTWFQAYLSRRQDQMDALIDRVARAGFGTLVITVDTPSPANRENNVRVGFSSPLRPTARLAWQGLTHPRWLLGVLARTFVHHGMPHFENWHGERGAPIFSKTLDVDIAQRGHLTWGHIAQIRDRWKGRLVLKGILNPLDARKAADHGVDGIIVSNHGGRQLDGAVPPMRALPAVLEQFRGGPVMLDSGARRGTDVVKAIALGAAAVFIGRPFNYAASVAGAAGVAHGIALLREEISKNMAMMGMTTLAQLDSSCLVPLRPGLSATAHRP
ncbi:alpha-hydroxy acid oxidase [Pseudacidovorax sp. NFM-22]|uniref:alpha-hydroxy acid oxidase n=1 Tax=Pseudacidovorax sp. NFM-22 TaxID=2744469 RepID=UPI001F1656DB|nr:alpha-hydroxy acid oxidase [Pseudacidovorax sp. NFM-22]